MNKQKILKLIPGKEQQDNIVAMSCEHAERLANIACLTVGGIGLFMSGACVMEGFMVYGSLSCSTLIFEVCLGAATSGMFARGARAITYKISKSYYLNKYAKLAESIDTLIEKFTPDQKKTIELYKKCPKTLSADYVADMDPTLLQQQAVVTQTENTQDENDQGLPLWMYVKQL